MAVVIKKQVYKICVIKQKLIFEDYFNCLGANRFENKTDYLQNNKIDADSLKEFLKDNRSVLLIAQSQKRSRTKKHNVFPEGVNKILMNANNDKQIQSIDFIETYAYGTSENIIRKNEEVEYRIITKQYKND